MGISQAAKLSLLVLSPTPSIPLGYVQQEPETQISNDFHTL